ncbi:MAG TPA: DnaA/Hda family protein [Spirochaetota bacterium]|nr:DnaA/Hda family protein [Spirochaetota bacterium]
MNVLSDKISRKNFILTSMLAGITSIIPEKLLAYSKCKNTTKSINISLGLASPIFSFDNFIVHSGNELAFAVANSILKKPATSYNPFYLYSQTGLGKTHLLVAMLNELNRIHPDKKICYITGPEFISDLFKSIKEKKRISFKNKFRNIDILLIDDTHDIESNDQSQKELLFIIKNLLSNGGQIVMTSNKYPNKFTDFYESLTKHFECGLITNIDPPDIEARIKILKKRVNHYEHGYTG